MAELDDLRSLLEGQVKLSSPKYAVGFSKVAFKRHMLLPLVQSCYDDARDLADSFPAYS